MRQHREPQARLWTERTELLHNSKLHLILTQIQHAVQLDKTELVRLAVAQFYCVIGYLWKNNFRKSLLSFRSVNFDLLAELSRILTRLPTHSEVDRFKSHINFRLSIIWLFGLYPSVNSFLDFTFPRRPFVCSQTNFAKLFDSLPSRNKIRKKISFWVKNVEKKGHHFSVIWKYYKRRKISRWYYPELLGRVQGCICIYMSVNVGICDT